MGALDALFVVAVYVLIMGVTTPARIFQGIARAVLGPAAFDGGMSAAGLGLAMHFGVALGWTAVYATLYAHWGRLRRLTRSGPGVLAAAVCFGPAIWLMMNQVIVPATQARPMAMGTWQWWMMVAAHIVIIALPMTSFIRDGEPASTTRQTLT